MLTERRAEEYVRQSDLRVPAPLKPASLNWRCRTLSANAWGYHPANPVPGRLIRTDTNEHGIETICVQAERIVLVRFEITLLFRSMK